jgi:hypothetical protein
VPADALNDGPGPAAALVPVKAALDAEAARLGDLALEQARTKLEVRLATERPKVLAALDAVGLAVRQAFTDAISLVYRLMAALAVLAFLMTLPLPQLPLKGRDAPAVATE